MCGERPIAVCLCVSLTVYYPWVVWNLFQYMSPQLMRLGEEGEEVQVLQAFFCPWPTVRETFDIITQYTNTKQWYQSPWSHRGQAWEPGLLVGVVKSTSKLSPHLQGG